MRWPFHTGVAGIGQKLQETVLHMLLGMGGDKSALALPPHHQILGCQLVNGLADRALAHAEPRRQLHFAGNGFTGLPFALLQTLQDQRLDLLVQRAERWRQCANTARRRRGRINIERKRGHGKWVGWMVVMRGVLAGW